MSLIFCMLSDPYGLLMLPLPLQQQAMALSIPPTPFRSTAHRGKMKFVMVEKEFEPLLNFFNIDKTALPQVLLIDLHPTVGQRQFKYGVFDKVCIILIFLLLLSFLLLLTLFSFSRPTTLD